MKRTSIIGKQVQHNQVEFKALRVLDMTTLLNNTKFFHKNEIKNYGVIDYLKFNVIKF